MLLNNLFKKIIYHKKVKSLEEILNGALREYENLSESDERSKAMNIIKDLQNENKIQKDILDEVLKDKYQFEDYLNGLVRCPKCDSAKIIPYVVFAVCTECGFKFNTLIERLSKVRGQTKKDAKKILATGRIVDIKKVDRILEILAKTTDDLEAADLWKKLQNLKDNLQ